MACLMLSTACPAGDDSADDTTTSTMPTSTDDGPATSSTTSPMEGTTTSMEEGTESTADGTTEEPPGDSSSGGSADQVPPTNAAELLPWLEAGEYEPWAAESSVHAPTGGSPHGEVRVFVNDVLLGSLEAGNPAHPQDAAAVKELYDGGGALIGWAVNVKVQADSAGGAGWYWYEIIDGGVVADGTGEGICTGCHGAGIDYVLTPFPLM